MKVVKSSNIKVYPCSNRNPSYDINSRYPTEYNIVSVVNRLVDMKSFCVTTFDSLPEDLDSFLFNVNGYLFDIDSSAIQGLADQLKGLADQLNGASMDGKQLYACICVGYIDNNSKYCELLPSKQYVSGGSVSTVSSGDSSPMDDDTSSEENVVGSEGLDKQFNGVVFIVGDPVECGHNLSGWETTGADNNSGIFGQFTPIYSNLGSYKKFILPIMEATYDSTNKINIISVPKESRVKFATTRDGTKRSVVIDDGELSD